MSDKATEPPASAANTVELNRIDAHGSWLDDLVIQHVAMNADKVGTRHGPADFGIQLRRRDQRDQEETIPHHV